MNDAEKLTILADIKQKQCPSCQIFCIFKSMPIDQMLEDWKMGQYEKLFELIEKRKSCYG